MDEKETLETIDGKVYLQLRNWTPQTPHTSLTTTTLKAWYSNTKPTAPTGPLEQSWKPYRIIKKTLKDKQTQPSHPPPAKQSSLRYSREIGWYFQYRYPFIITEKPTPNPKGQQSAQNTGTRTKTKITENKARNSKTGKKQNQAPQLELKIKLKRIDKQPGFESLRNLWKNR